MKWTEEHLYPDKPALVSASPQSPLSLWDVGQALTDSLSQVLEEEFLLGVSSFQVNRNFLYRFKVLVGL